MKITMWGTRGSIPVSGAGFVRYGGATTCLEVQTAGERIVIDCGTGVAELGKYGGSNWADTLVLQTHLHWDHIQGFPFFGALFDPTARLTFRARPRDGESMRQVLEAQMARPTFPVGLDIVPATLDFVDLEAESGRFAKGAVEISWTEVWHPSGASAFRIDDGSHAFVFTGDCEVQQGRRDALAELAAGADVLVMDAQYFPEEYHSRRGWGHSTPLDAVELAKEVGVKRLILTHHDPSHDDARLEEKLAVAREAARGSRLVVDNAYDRMVVNLDRVAHRHAA